jgi:hypothetical protein
MFQMVDHAREKLYLQGQQNVVEIFEDIVEGAGRVPDHARDFAGGETGNSIAFNDGSGRVENELAELFR